MLTRLAILFLKDILQRQRQTMMVRWTNILINQREINNKYKIVIKITWFSFISMYEWGKKLHHVALQKMAILATAQVMFF